MLRFAVRNFLKRVAPLRKVVQALKTLEARYRDNVWILRGQERTSQEPLTIFFAGHLESKNYIAHLILGENWTESKKMRIRRKQVQRRARADNARHDLAIVQMDTIPPALARQPDVFFVPCWVGSARDLHAAAELLRHSEKVKSDIRRIRKNHLGYRVTRDPREFERFYHTMYLPYIKRVYGDHAFLMTYEDMQAAIAQCELFLITQDGQDVAGGILVYEETECARSWSVGVKDGDIGWVKAGALSALQHFQTQYLLDKGVIRLHCGASRPFLNDGALRFKKKWGAGIVDRTEKWFAILPLRGGAGVTAFLVNNPFIYERDGKLQSAFFLTADTQPSEADIVRLFHDLYMPGLDGVTLFRLKVGGGTEPDLSIPPYVRVNASGSICPR